MKLKIHIASFKLCFASSGLTEFSSEELCYLLSVVLAFQVVNMAESFRLAVWF